MKDYEISASSQDYTFTAGKPRITDNIMNNIYLSLMTKKGTWLGDKTFGSRLHLLKRAKLTLEVAATAKEFCEEALEWIVKGGRADALSVTTQPDKPNGRLTCLIEIHQNGEPITYEHFVEVR